jgi:protein-S-isoprenylcysteine O-methyltransferase Ste14
MNTTVEKLRRATSWAVAILLFFTILFSRNPYETTLIYKGIEIIGLILVALGTLGRIWCSIYIVGRKDEELCLDGPYSMVRNPLYLFSFFGLIGIMCAAQHMILVLIVIPIYWVYYFFVIKSEEDRLISLFGDEYRKYQSRVKSIFPSFKHYHSKTQLEINPVTLSKAVSDAGCFLWVLILVEFLVYLKMITLNGKPILPMWWHMPF